MITELKERFFGGSERNRNLKKNIIGSVCLKGVSILVQLALIPLTLSYLSEELYGIWLTVSSVVLWLNFFDVGFSLGLKNRLAEAIAKKDYIRGKQLVSTTYGMLILIFVPLGIILELIVPEINWSRFLNVAETYNSVLIDVMRILIISFVLQMIFNTISTIVSAFQQVALGSSFPVIGNVISLGVIWILTRYTSPSLINMAVAVSFLPTIVFIISSLILFNGFLRPVKPSVSAFNRSVIKDIFSLGIKFFIIQIQIIVMQQATNILISNVSNPDYVTYYNITYRYIGSAMMVFTLILGPLWPAFTDAYAKNDFKWMNGIYRKLVRVYLVVFCLIWVCYFASPLVYHIWIGDKTQIPSMMTLALSIYFCISAWDSFQINLINGIGAVKLQSYVTGIGLFVHIPLSLLLGKYIGAYGVIVSMSAITMMYSLFFTIQIRKILGQKAMGIWNA